MKSKYKHIERLGLVVHEDGYVAREDLRDVLDREGIAKRFSSLYGCQTAHLNGPYPWDVESVLVRIYDKKLTGTQLYWD